ncbi:ABC transporter ATP-binding protein [Pseudalkalibacillus hwajinpoensis]|uniref:ABC transporter ATP-binding protein n=1 Tax=Guptibacillus hwajinpoensis TaxID=208199 RepID=A0A4U1MGM8_9BACL|nr:ABC transporter ATP-binding protein [Pseudalkalibacillus hwajinpoensis]TKD70073.1 ABC transporter ATP-binding protein [Pseudalkalibacillus hwajinpoensis]
MDTYPVQASVTKRYGKTTILDGIELTFQRGEIFGLLGPSGSGKTTLVKLLCGIEEATEGTVQVFNQQMPDLNVMNRMGYMAQADALYVELTAKENLEFFASLSGVKRTERKERIQEVMKLVDLEQHLDKKVETYSGGMKRRLSLAIALLHKPDILLLDEPTVGIDPSLRQRIWDTFEALRMKGVLILVTTHVMDEAERCSRLGLIREGKLIAVGTPDEIKTNTKSTTIEQAFLTYGGVKR